MFSKHTRMTGRSCGVSLVAGAILVFGSTALAPVQANPALCLKYAQDAVQDHVTAQQKKCGFKPPVWSGNQKAHYDWCMHGNNSKVAPGETQKRKQALQKCVKAKSPGLPSPGQKVKNKKDHCDLYAKNAVTANTEAQKLGCGFKPPVWSSNKKMHFDWCMHGNNYKSATAHTKDRGQKLNACKANKAAAAKDKSCRNYALKAVDYNREAQKHGCGFKPPVWSNNHQAHFDWCMHGNNSKVAPTRNQERADELKKCLTPTPLAPGNPPAPGGTPPKDCNLYANEAVKTAAKADALGCGFVGPRWLQDYKAHFDFCQKQPDIGILIAEHAARDQQFASCAQGSGMSGSGGSAPGGSPSAGGDWVFPDSHVRLLTVAEVQTLSPAELWQARNEIFARKGYIFKTKKARSFFKALPWYQPVSKSVKLNATEAANVDLIRTFE